MKITCLGAFIRDIRKQRGMTQSELANGICTSRYLSNIENGIQSPTIHKIELFSLKLGIDLNKYSYLLQYTNPIETISQNKKMEDLLKNSKYDELLNHLTECEDMDDYKNGVNLQLIQWYKAISLYEKNDLILDCRDKLEKAFQVTNSLKISSLPNNTILTLQELKILNSYMKTSIIIKNYEEALSLCNFIQSSFEIRNKHFLETDDDLLLKVLYNKSYLLNEMKDNYTSLLTIDNGIKYCIRVDKMTLLSNFYYLKGKILYDLGDTQQAYNLFDLFINIRKAREDFEISEKYIKILNDHYGYKFGHN